MIANNACIKVGEEFAVIPKVVGQVVWLKRVLYLLISPALPIEKGCLFD